MRTPESFAGKENLDKEKLRTLHEAVGQGKILHGSPYKIEGRIEPRKGTDISGATHKTLEGVYGTSDVKTALAAALLQKGNDSTTFWEGKGDELHFSGKGDVSLGPGYVYILPNESFRAHSGYLEGQEDVEIVSSEPVEPEAVVAVDPSIIDAVDGFDTDLPY